MVSKSIFTPRIVIIDGKDKGKVIHLENGSAVIGRSKGDVIVHDPRVSRSHVAINYDAKSGRLTFTDLKSLNGTLVNGESAEAGELHDGDRLQIGNTIFDCQISPPGEQTESKYKPTDSAFRNEPAIHSDPSETSLPEVIPEPQPEPHQPAMKEREEHTQSFQIRRWFLGMSPRVRRAGLAVVALVACFVYLSMDTGGGGKSSGGDRDVTSIKRLGSEGRFAEAVEKAEDLIKKDPARAEVHLLLGDLYSRQGKFEMGLGAFKKAVELDRNNGVAHVRLARLYTLSNRAQEAELEQREIQRIVIEAPTRDFFVELGTFYLELRNSDLPPKQMIILGQALQNKFAPGETIGLKLEAVGLILDNQPGGAFALLDKAREIDPADPMIYQFTVLAKVRGKDPAGAFQVAQQWVQTFPEDTRPLLYIAHWKFENKEFADAMSYLQKIEVMGSKSTDDPTIANAFNLMGKIHLEQNQKEQAANAFRRSCDLGFTASCQEPTFDPNNAPPPAAATNQVPPTETEPKSP